jgi:hypothetical protein
LVLRLKVRPEGVDPLLQGRDRPVEVSALVVQLCHLYLKKVLFLVLDLNLVLGHYHCVLGQLVSLLEVHDQFILPLYHYFVIFNLLFVHYDFVSLVLTNTIHKVVQRFEFDV